MGRRLVKLLVTVFPLVCLSLVAECQTVKLTDGSPVTLRLTQELRSGREREGDRIRLTCSDTVADSRGVILIKQGAKGGGSVTRSSKAGMFGKGGKIDFRAEWVEAVDGSKVPVRSLVNRKGSDYQGGVIAGAVFVLWPLIFIQGKNATIHDGFEFTAYVDGDRDINVPVVAAGPGGGTTPGPGTAALPPNLQSLSVRDVACFRAGEKAVLVAFMVENPNETVGLRNAHVTITALDASGNVVGSNTSLTVLSPEQTLYWLGPKQACVLVKRVGVERECNSVTVHVSQPWVPWAGLTTPKVTVISGKYGRGKVEGEVRNDSDQPVAVEVTAVLKGQAGAVGAACGWLKSVRPGETRRFSLESSAYEGEATADVSAVGTAEAVGD